MKQWSKSYMKRVWMQKDKNLTYEAKKQLQITWRCNRNSAVHVVRLRKLPTESFSVNEYTPESVIIRLF